MAKGAQTDGTVPVYDFQAIEAAEGLSIVVGPYHFVSDSFTVHRHHFGELVFALSGHGGHITDHGTYRLEPGDVFYISPGQTHGFTDAIGLDIVNIAFDPTEHLEPLRGDLGRLSGFHGLFFLEPAEFTESGPRNRLRLSPQVLESVRPKLEQMVREYKNRLPGAETTLRGLFYGLLVELCRSLSADFDSAGHPLGPLAKVAAHLEAKFAEPCRLADVAAVAGMSVNSLLRRFERAFAISPMRYLANIRMEHARRLLATTDLRVAEVGRACGFEDANYFARSFKRAVGKSPTRWRTTPELPG